MDYDIRGSTAEYRFPWQRDVATQCTLPQFSAADASRRDGIHSEAECNNYSEKRWLAWRDAMAGRRPDSRRSIELRVNSEPSAASIASSQPPACPSHVALSNAAGRPPTSPPFLSDSKDMLRSNHPPLTNCSADSLISIGDDHVGNEEDEKHMKQYEQSVGLGRRPAVISSYNFFGASPGPDVVPEKDKSTEVNREPPQNEERPRGEHRTNSMSALSRTANYCSSQSLSGSKDTDIKMKSKSLHSVLKIGPSRKKKPEALKTFLQHCYRRKDFGNEQLASYRKAGLTDILVSKGLGSGDTLSEAEMKKREAMWEVFTNECTFLFEQLLVLRHCFVDPLKEAQVEGHLLEVDLPKLFGNLEDLCQISYAFCQDFVQSLKASDTSFCSMDALVACLDNMVQNSHNGEAYQEYVLKYKGAVSYLSALRQAVPDFSVYETFCSQDQRCNRLRLKDLLVAPMHHWTRLPVILKNVCKKTKEAAEKDALSTALQKVEASLRVIDDKMEELKPLERLQEMQQQLVWPTITDLDPKTYVPEFLRDIIQAEPREIDLADQRRELICEGPLQLLTGEKEKVADVYVFLLSDMILITKCKKEFKKKDLQKKISVTDRSGGEAYYYIQKQPMPLESVHVYDIKMKDSSSLAMKSMFAITQSNTYQQTIAVATFQAQSEDAKVWWLESLTLAKEKCGSPNSSRHDSFSRQFTAEEREKLRRCTRLLTVEDSSARGRSRSTGSNGEAGGGIGCAVVGRGSANWLTIAASSSAIAKATSSMGHQSNNGSAGHLTSRDSPDGACAEQCSPTATELFSYPSIDSGDGVFF